MAPLLLCIVLITYFTPQASNLKMTTQLNSEIMEILGKSIKEAVQKIGGKKQCQATGA